MTTQAVMPFPGDGAGLARLADLMREGADPSLAVTYGMPPPPDDAG